MRGLHHLLRLNRASAAAKDIKLTSLKSLNIWHDVATAANEFASVFPNVMTPEDARTSREDSCKLTSKTNFRSTCSWRACFLSNSSAE